MTPVPAGRGLSLAEVVRFTILTLTRWAREKAWGEIRITVQAGRIEFVHDHRSYRDSLPGIGGPEADQAMKQLVAVGGQ